MAMTLEQQRALALARARQAQAEAQQGQATAPGLFAPVAPGSGMVAGDIIGQMASGGGTVPQPSPQVARTAQSMAQLPEGVQSIPGNMAAFRQGVAEGIPIVGPLATNAADAVGSQIAALLTGGDAGQIREQAVGDFEASMEPYGVARGVGNVVGAVGPLAAASTTQLGGQLLGLTGGTGQRVGMGVASGFGIGFGDTLARTGDPMEALKWGAGGAAAGAAFPLAERPIAAIARMLTGQTRAPEAARVVANELERAGIQPSQLPAQLSALGEGAVPADLSRNLRFQAAAIANTPGRGQGILDEILSARNAGTNSRIQFDVNEALGPSVGPRAFDAQITGQQRVLSPMYDQVLASGVPADLAPVANQIGSLGSNAVGEIATSLSRVRDLLVNPQTGSLVNDPHRIMGIRQELDDMIAGAEGNRRRLLTQIRTGVDDILAEAAPGIKDIDRQFAELAQQRTAYETGQSALDSARSSLTPGDLQSFVNENADAVVSALSAGARADIDRVIGTSANNITALKNALKGDGSWNRDRLVTLFGQERADQLLAILEREAAFNTTYNMVLQNSATAGRQAAQAERAPWALGGGSSVTDWITGAPRWAINSAARTRNESVNAQIARLLTDGAPSDSVVEQLSSALAQNRGMIPPSAIALLLTRGGE